MNPVLQTTRDHTVQCQWGIIQSNVRGGSYSPMSGGGGSEENLPRK